MQVYGEYSTAVALKGSITESVSYLTFSYLNLIASYVGNTEGLVAVLLGTSIPVTFTITVPVTVILTFVVFYLVFKSRKKCISGGSEEDQEQKKQEPTYSTNIESQVEVEMQACPAYDTFLTAEKENTAEYV